MIAPSRFRLWDHAPSALWKVTNEQSRDMAVRVLRFDPDRVGCASMLALAELASQSDGILSANISRVDIPGVAARQMPWVTWVTTPRIPAARDAGPHDRLILVEPAWRPLAQEAGWAPDRIDVAGWPRFGSSQVPSGEAISLIADTTSLSMPERVREYSSHGLLWEFIEQELSADPFAVGEDVEVYLRERMRRFQIAANGFDRELFINRLIVPAFQQGVASVLIQAGAPLQLFGQGWSELTPFAPSSAGPLHTRAQFEQAVAQSAMLIHAWPSRFVHPIDACGRLVTRAFGRSKGEFLRELSRGSAGPSKTSQTDGPRPLSIDHLLSCL